MKVWQKAHHLCSALKSESFVQEDSILLDAIERVHQKTWIAWCEHGPRELRRLAFYLNQKLQEKAFLEGLATDYGKGSLSMPKGG